jgi:hypothetical protein
MSIMALAFLYSGPNETGTSLVSGLGSGDRYAQITNSLLSGQGLLDSVASGQLDCTEADLNLICFHNNDYTGQFFQLSLPHSEGSSGFWHAGQTQSALLIASNNVGVKENRVSFVDQFRTKWDNNVDGQLQGTQVTRDVEPLLTWQMFPTNDQWLSSSQTYLRIHQPLHVHMPWYWSDYQASMDYNSVLYITGDSHLRAYVADWECWVEPGAKRGDVHSQLDPKVEAGMSTLRDQMNQQLAATDLLGPIKAVFYLPDKQLSPIGTGTLGTFGSNTSNDITIVVQT